MKVRVAKHKDGLHYQGEFYAKDEDGYCEIPENIALRAGYIRVNQLRPPAILTDPPPDDMPDDEPGAKEALVEKAGALGMGAPSTLRRWSVEKLQAEIASAETEANEE